VTPIPTKYTPATVPFGTRRAGEARDPWSWVEPSVWTERMLTALDEGVKGGRWFSLVDKVYSMRNLRAAFERVKANRGAAGVDHVTVAMFEARLDENLDRLHESLSRGTYRPQAVRRVWIPKPGRKEKRPLGVPTVRDRVVQTALRSVVEPIFERDFAEHSYGFRPARGSMDALRRVDTLLKAGYTHVVDADLKSYFDTISHGRLLELVRTKISDGRVLALLESFLEQDVLDGMTTWTPERGTPQGAVVSPLLSNIYLDPLDHLMAGQGIEMVRYADDFVTLCRSEAEARRALAVVEQWTTSVSLTLHPEKTRIVDASQKGVGFDFLGYHFTQHYRWVCTKSVRKLKDTLRAKTKRTNGTSLATIIANVNRTVRGWYAYFRHSHRTTFDRFDGWLRMRLRSILRKRRGGKGRGRGLDHHRWTNAFFAKQGLFSTFAASASASQSS